MAQQIGSTNHTNLLPTLIHKGEREYMRETSAQLKHEGERDVDNRETKSSLTKPSYMSTSRVSNGKLITAT